MQISELTQNYIEDLTKLATTDVQKEALKYFKLRGLPHTKMEDWLYTKVTDVLPSNFKKVSEKTSLKNIKVVGKYQVVFLNGIFSKEDSFTPDEVTIEIVQSENALNSDFKDDNKDIFAMLNASSSSSFLSLKVPKSYICDDVISIVHISDFDNSFTTPRLHVEVEKFAECDFVEIFTGVNDKSYNQISVTTFEVREGAKTSHIKVQEEGNKAFHAGSLHADIAQNATFTSFTFTTGAKKSRNHIEIRLKGVNSIAHVDGLYTLSGEQHCDNYSHLSHVVEHTNSTQLFKGVLDDNSRAVFTGKILVCRDAQKVNSEQLNKNLLLSKKAHVDTRPQLEVYADDVKCAHGATVGQMSEEEAFYLQSRGLSQDRAQKLLIHAFCAETILKIGNEKIESYLSEVLFESFEKEALAKLGND